MPKIRSVNVVYAGGSLQGYINISYAKLVEALGEPGESDGYKTDAEWSVEFVGGDIASIYNYKDGRNYLGEEGLAVEDITEWHIGGTSKDVVRYLTSHLLNPWPPGFEDIRQQAEY